MKKKKTIKINFKYFSEGFNPENNFFINNLRKLYDVEINDNPDYLFYSVYPEIKNSRDLSKTGDFIKKLSPKVYLLLRKFYSKIINFSLKDRLPLPEGDYIKILYSSDHLRPDMSKCDWAFSEYFEEEINSPKHMRLPIMANDYQLKDSGIPSINKKIDFIKTRKEKKKFCNFIYSQEINSRNNFFKELSKYKRVDSPGRCMNNMPSISHKSPKESRLSKNWVVNKLDFLKKYKFTISFENANLSGYVTEKLTHPMLVNSIPIYFGHKDVGKEFNTKSFINSNDFNNMKDFVNYIVKVDKDDVLYEKILREPFYKDNQLPRDLDIKRVLKRFREIFGD
ncbi:MAG: hypothetical protein KKC19_00775 [Nanoarchaeota archaeon]|nr:hypothetical protein [Nanoarchaeota archaeon]